MGAPHGGEGAAMTPREIAERHLREWRKSDSIGALDSVMAAACEEAAAEARRAEREACAAIADAEGDLMRRKGTPVHSLAAGAVYSLAAAIRARKEAE